MVTVFGTAGYWVAANMRAQQAGQEYRGALAGWEGGARTEAQACQASLRWLQAEAAIPFADRNNAAVAHLARMRKFAETVYSSALTTFSVNKADEMRWEVDACVREAERLAAKTK